MDKKGALAAALGTLAAVCLFAGCGIPTSAGTPEGTPGGSENRFRPGTYTGSAEGKKGPMTVEVTLSSDRITDVRVTEHSVAPGIVDPSIEEIPKEIIEAQSLDVDVVSGATISSLAIINAAGEALISAGIDPSSLVNEHKSDKGKEKADLTFKAGTYLAESSGYNGPVTVRVTFTDSAVLDIGIDASSETEHVGTAAYDILIPEIIEANGSGVDVVSGATFSSLALKNAVALAAEKASVSDLDRFKKNKVEHQAKEPIEERADVVVVGAGGAGMAAAAQAAQDGNTVAIIEKNAEIGGNTLVSGGQFQSVMPYLVWDPNDPDAETGVGYDGKTYKKVVENISILDELRLIANWSEEPFDEEYYKTHEFVAGDTEELSKHGVHPEYLKTLRELKKEIKAYLEWADKKVEAGANEVTLFSTINLHIFQTYYGGLRPTADMSEWVYGEYELVSQFIHDGQDLKLWLEDQGARFIEDTQPTLIGALWYRENEFDGAVIDGQEYPGRWGTYFMAPLNTITNTSPTAADNKIFVRTAAEKLIVEDGRVTGVTGKMYDGTEVTVHADKGVILATGGYAANINEVLEYNKYWDSAYLTKNTQTTNRSSLMGDGIAMGQEAGADITGMKFTQLMPIAWVDNGNLAYGAGNYAVWINPTTGKRFVDETSERDVLSLAEFRNGMEVDGTKGVFVEIYNKEQLMPAPTQLLEGDCEGRYYRVKIDGLGELFRKIGVTADPETVRKTIEEYDAAVIAGASANEFPDVKKTNADRTIGNCEKDENGRYIQETYDLDNTLLTVRLMAPSTHHTMGGLKVDVNRHVLDKDGNPIEGLYAAGEVTGGIHGGNRLGGNSIVEIFVSGRTAAKAVTADAE